LVVFRILILKCLNKVYCANPKRSTCVFFQINQNVKLADSVVCNYLINYENKNILQKLYRPRIANKISYRSKRLHGSDDWFRFL